MTVFDLHRRKLRCVVMRGGTTRGFFFRPQDLPGDPEMRDAMLLDVVAGSELHQADGLGANDMLLGKVVTVWPSDRDDADVECTFGAITPGSARIKYGSNCGNLSAAVALYAAEEELRPGLYDTVRLFNPQSRTRVDARFMEAAEFRERTARTGTVGMAMTGVPVELAFVDPAGTIGRGLLPTGRAVDRIRLPSGSAIEASIVDSGVAYVFVQASDVGLASATARLDARQEAALLDIAEAIRGQAAVLCGLVDRPEDARRLTPAVPKVALVSGPEAFALADGSRSFAAGDADLLGRIVSSQSFHRAYAVTGAMATIAAAVIPGSTVNRSVGASAFGPSMALRIGHPGGVIELRQDWHAGETGVSIDRTYVVRTARRLMTGLVHLPEPAAAAAVAGLRTTRIWTSAPMPNGNSAPMRSRNRVTAR